MKKLKISLFLILFILILNVSNVNAASNPYSEKGPYGTNCTWYAWKTASEKSGITLPGWGNAKNWYNNAKNDEYTVGKEPKANSIIVWGSWTSYGHVGYVESVDGNILHVWDSSMSCIDREDEEFIECMANGVSEETDKICYANAKRIACEYTISPDEYGITGYIYLDYEPNKITSITSQNNETSKTENHSIKAEITKSSNNYLSNITLSDGDIKFDKEILEYDVEVLYEVDKIAVNATLEDNKSTIKGIGDYTLNTGVNEIRLIVTAEDNSEKEYVIKIVRKEKINVDNDGLNSSINVNEIKNKIEENSNQDNKKLIFFGFGLIIIVFCIIFIYIKKIKKSD